MPRALASACTQMNVSDSLIHCTQQNVSAARHCAVVLFKCSVVFLPLGRLMAIRQPGPPRHVSTEEGARLQRLSGMPYALLNCPHKRPTDRIMHVCQRCTPVERHASTTIYSCQWTDSQSLTTRKVLQAPKPGSWRVRVCLLCSKRVRSRF